MEFIGVIVYVIFFAWVIDELIEAIRKRRTNGKNR